MNKTRKRTPKGAQITFKFLKANTNRMKNGEQLKNDVEIDCSRDSATIQVFFSSSFFFSLLFLQSFTSGPQNLPLSPSSCLFIAKQGIWGDDNQPRRASYFTIKLFGGPGEPEASLGEPGFRKSFQMTLLPPFWVFFAFFSET